jgi:hypothetical protein
LVSCARVGSGGANYRPADIYAAGPNATEVQALLGDANWWAGPPSFEVRPLDVETMPATQRFSIIQRFIHIGSAEEWLVRYTVYDKTTSATAQMTTYRVAFGASPSSPREGDQILYYGLAGGGAAPYVTRTFVRVGQIIAQIIWSRKDGIPTLQQLGNNAAKVVANLKKATSGKLQAAPLAVEQRLQPPPGLDITRLGSARLPVEAWLVMASIAIPEPVRVLLHSEGVDKFDFGDYALNSDTHMEVRTALLTFASPTDATDWASTFAPGSPDQSGIASSYIDALGEYHYFFTDGLNGGMLVCASTVATEAASRACEKPMERTAISWKLALSGLA